MSIESKHVTWRKLALIIVTSFTVHISATKVMAGEWHASGWQGSDLVTYVSPGSPGGATASSTSPLVTAYQGQSGSYATAQGNYYQSWSWWTTNYYLDPPHGGFDQGANLIGTLGFFENPIEPSYSSSVFTGSWSNSGPPDYSTAPGSISSIHGLSFYVSVGIIATVYNYGHASTEYTANTF